MQQDQVQGLIVIGVAFLVMLMFVYALVAARRRRRREFAEEERRDAVEAREHPEEVAALERAAELARPDAIADEEEDEAEEEAKDAVVQEAALAGAASDRRDLAGDDAALEQGLERTRSSFWGKITGLLGRGTIDAGVLDGLEEALITADVGVGLASKLVDELRADWKAKRIDGPAAVRAALKSRVEQALGVDEPVQDPLALGGVKPRIILFVGVNGVGKTTTIGKIAAKLRGRGANVVLAAGDTFRAAAAEQLAIWADRTGAKIVRGNEGADPASVMFNALEHAKAHDADVVLCDTAGRLHTKTELMDEIKKVKRACSKARDGAPDETWLVVDSTTGQNALQQAKEFNQVLGLTGVILTKLDGTAKGGVVIAIRDALKIPVRFIGVGEKAEDLRPFDARQFVEALFKG